MHDQNNFPSLYPTGMPPSPPDTDVSDDDMTEKPAQKGDNGTKISPQKGKIAERTEGASSVAASQPGLISESVMTTLASFEESNNGGDDEKNGSGGGAATQDNSHDLDKEGESLPTSTARLGVSGSCSVVSSVTAGTQSEKYKSYAASSTSYTTGSFVPSVGSSASSSIVEKSYDDSSTASSNAVDDTWTDGELPPSLLRNIVAREIVSNSQTYRTSNRTQNACDLRPRTGISILDADGGFVGNNNQLQRQQQQPQPQNAIQPRDNQLQQYQQSVMMAQQQVPGPNAMPQEVQITQPMSTTTQAVAAPGMLMYHQSSPAAVPPMAPSQTQPHQQPHQQVRNQHPSALSRASSAITEKSAMTSSRRAITLRLLEDVVASADYENETKESRLRSFLRRGSGRMGRSLSSGSLHNVMQSDRGTITVSWYEGTTTSELQDHVRNSVSRKLKLKVGGSKQLKDIRLIDEGVVPNEEVVLSPYIPNGSHFLLKFTIKDSSPSEPSSRFTRKYSHMSSFHSRAPDSPSAAPSPYPSSADLLNLQQLQMLGAAVLQNSNNQSTRLHNKTPKTFPLPSLDDAPENDATQSKTSDKNSPIKPKLEKETKENDDDNHDDDNNVADASDPDELVEERLRQLNELLLLNKRSKSLKSGKPSRRTQRRRQEEKKQVIFILANYFVLFLSLIAISAEIHERAPGWMKWVEAQMDHVQDCAADRDALFECVSNGDIAGLYASFLFYITRSVTTKRLLLFGFDSTKKLWTVVYEALVTAVCWGTSYIFIRRGLNPDTREGFLHKYWKDAVYGSLAGFNAAFLKAVLKNLIPQEVLEDALESRQLKIVDWLQQVF